MSDLYRRIEGPVGLTDGLEGDWWGAEYEVEGERIEVAFVKVEPCEHGNYAPHWYPMWADGPATNGEVNPTAPQWLTCDGNPK